MSTSKAGIRELKAHLSAYLRKVEAGEPVTITRRGKPIGRIVPVEEEKSVRDKMERLQESGLVSWSGDTFAPGQPSAVVKGKPSVSDLLLEDRR